MRKAVSLITALAIGVSAVPASAHMTHDYTLNQARIIVKHYAKRAYGGFDTRVRVHKCEWINDRTATCKAVVQNITPIWHEKAIVNSTIWYWIPVTVGVGQ